MVSRAQTEQLAIYARKILDKDKQARKNLYKEVGLPDDKTAKQLNILLNLDYLIK